MSASLAPSTLLAAPILFVLIAASATARAQSGQATNAPQSPATDAAADNPKEEEPPKNPELELNDKHDASQKSLVPGATSPARPDIDAVSEPPKKEDKDDPEKKFTVGGYVEAFYQWNFNVPGNGISNYRGYDYRHNTFAIQNAVVDVGFRAHDILARVALQAGLAPAAIYRDEPNFVGVAGADGAAESTPELWRYLQRASLGWQATKRILLEAGIFPSTTGVESLAVKENWNWSRSTASVRLPTYQTGIRATFNASNSVDIFGAVINGWNSVVDNNDEKSVVAGAHYRWATKLTLSGSYFGGIERNPGAPEGRPWRHGFEAWAQYDVTDYLSLGADGSAGFENTRFGVDWWTSAAFYARTQLLEWLYVAGRADRLWEDPASNAEGTSTPILIPAKSITSLTATIDVRPVKGLSLRTEFRHDFASTDLFFRGDVQGDGSDARPWIPNARTQSSVLLGATAWF